MGCDRRISEEGDAVDSWVHGTLLFQRWEEMKREILLHKWYESEKAGYDIGWERARVDWMLKYGSRRTSSN